MKLEDLKSNLKGVGKPKGNPSGRHLKSPNNLKVDSLVN